MIRAFRLPLLSAAGLLAGVAAGPARGAQSYAGCTGFIDAVPASITTQGVWCLRGHRFTSQTSGAAISILADNRWARPDRPGAAVR